MGGGEKRVGEYSENFASIYVCTSILCVCARFSSTTVHAMCVHFR